VLHSNNNRAATIQMPVDEPARRVESTGKKGHRESVSTMSSAAAGLRGANEKGRGSLQPRPFQIAGLGFG
jgi:hypothetical protein